MVVIVREQQEWLLHKSRGAEGDSKGEAMSSTIRDAVLQHLNKETRAGLVTVTRVSYSPVISKAIVTRQVQGQTNKSSQQGKDKINKVHGQV